MTCHLSNLAPLPGIEHSAANDTDSQEKPSPIFHIKWMEDLEYLRCSRVSRVDILCLNIDIQRHRECVLIKMIDLNKIVSSMNNHILLLMNSFF